VDLTFGDADLAGLCNCERRMVQRWGDDGSRQVGRRLFELSALAHHSEIELLPSAVVAREPGGLVTVEFDRGGVTIQGVLGSGSNGRTSAGKEGLLVTSVVVRRRKNAK
jgi:hypothetical protein